MGRSLAASLLVAALAGCSTVVPTRADRTFHILSFDDNSCGAWARTANAPAARQVYLFWFRGFASGVNYADPTYEVTTVAMPDMVALAAYIDRFCRDNPLEPFVAAAPRLVGEIRAARR